MLSVCSGFLVGLPLCFWKVGHPVIRSYDAVKAGRAHLGKSKGSDDDNERERERVHARAFVCVCREREIESGITSSICLMRKESAGIRGFRQLLLPGTALFS